jgi:hypothetical protein
MMVINSKIKKKTRFLCTRFFFFFIIQIDGVMNKWRTSIIWFIDHSITKRTLHSIDKRHWCMVKFDYHTIYSFVLSCKYSSLKNLQIDNFLSAYINASIYLLYNCPWINASLVTRVSLKLLLKEIKIQ